MRSTKATRRLPLVVVIALLAISSSSSRAEAQPLGGDKVAAEALFEDGRKLVAEGKYADACPKFAESERLDGSASTLLNLANCWEKLGHSATAWATYKEAESAASAAHRQDYMDTAARHARALAPTLARLTIFVPQPIEGMQVKRDGVLVGPAEWGSPIPIDTGSHTIEASATGYKAWAMRVDVPRDGASAAVTVPSLEARPVETRPDAPPPEPKEAPPPAPVPLPVESTPTGTTQRTTGLIVAGAGVVGLGVSGVFAFVAKSKYDSSVSDCEANNRNVCGPQGISQRDDARSMGNAATVAFGVGAAAILAGGALWLTAPRGTSGTHGGAWLGIAPTVGGVVASGAW